MSVRTSAWVDFDALVETAAAIDTNPWTLDGNGDCVYRPDYDLLRSLLAVPLRLNASSQTGVPALALDVWTAYEFRRAGFHPDAVWPRSTEPRVLTPELRSILGNLRGDLRDQLTSRLAKGQLAGASSATAKIPGKNYVKQVDVVMSAWTTGPELMVSTKRMDSSFGKNAANRVEESYGDAKNLRLRHPRSALGFVYSLRSTALTEEPDKAEWLMDLLAKLGREDDAYDAVTLIIPDWTDVRPAEAESGHIDELPADEDALEAAGLLEAETGESEAPASGAEHGSGASPGAGTEVSVDLNLDAVPPELRPERFFDVMVRHVLDNSPINFHREARERLAHPIAG